MKEKINLLKAFVLVIITSTFLLSCVNREERYVVLPNGDFPTFLDTKTNEVYVILPVADDGKPIIHKKSLANFEK